VAVCLAAKRDTARRLKGNERASKVWESKSSSEHPATVSFEKVFVALAAGAGKGTPKRDILPDANEAACGWRDTCSTSGKNATRS